MNNDFMLCAGLLAAGLAGQANAEAGSPGSMWGADAGWNIASEDCFANYRAPVVQRGAANYPPATGAYPHVRSRAGHSADCSHGHCQDSDAGATGAECFGSNYPLPDSSRYYPANGGSRYNTPPAMNYAPPRANPYPAQPRYDASWNSNTFRPDRSPSYPGSSNPLFN